jgi:hypothetical protein
MGLRSGIVKYRFPTLKRGANKLCASGAAERTLMQCSIKPRVCFLLSMYGLKPVPFIEADIHY